MRTSRGMTRRSCQSAGDKSNRSLEAPARSAEHHPHLADGAVVHEPERPGAGVRRSAVHLHARYAARGAARVLHSDLRARRAIPEDELEARPAARDARVEVKELAAHAESE